MICVPWYGLGMYIPGVPCGIDWLNSSLPCVFFLSRRLYRKKSPMPINNATNAAPIAIPTVAPVDKGFESSLDDAVEVMKGCASEVLSESLAAVRFPWVHPSFWQGFSRQHPMNAVDIAEQVYQRPEDAQASAGMEA